MQAVLDGAAPQANCSVAVLQAVVDELQAKNKRRAVNLAKERRDANIAAGGARWCVAETKFSWQLFGGCKFASQLQLFLQALRSRRQIVDMSVGVEYIESYPCGCDACATTIH